MSGKHAKIVSSIWAIPRNELPVLQHLPRLLCVDDYHALCLYRFLDLPRHSAGQITDLRSESIRFIREAACFVALVSAFRLARAFKRSGKVDGWAVAESHGR